MATARSQQIDLQSTPYYHVISRCVRRAFLCGYDTFSGKNFDHRKQWIVDRMQCLASGFAIDICAYAVMSNHYHIVLHVDAAQSEAWSDTEVIERWGRLFPASLAARFQSEDLKPHELEALNIKAALWRKRLTDISWFMRCMNESLAREANKEDQCKGRFWEGRYKSQALLDEGALLTCMAYVDLNPIRAGLAKTPEKSDFTSIQQRINQYQITKRNNKKQSENQRKNKQDTHLKKHENTQSINLMSCNQPEIDDPCLPITAEDYIALIDWTGRAIREDKKGAIPSHLQPILTRLKVKPDKWVQFATSFQQKFAHFAGNMRLEQYRPSGYQRVPGVGAARQLYLAA
jgi:putative transposase